MAKPQAITVPQMQKFVDDIGLDKPCIVCGHDSWSIHTEEVDGVLRLALGRQMSARDDRFFPTYSMNCEKCGFLKLFYAEVINQWVAENA